MDSVRIQVSVRKFRFITQLGYTVMHTGSRVYSIVHDNCLMLCISAEMTNNKAH